MPSDRIVIHFEDPDECKNLKAVSLQLDISSRGKVEWVATASYEEFDSSLMFLERANSANPDHLLKVKFLIQSRRLTKKYRDKLKSVQAASKETTKHKRNELAKLKETEEKIFKLREVASSEILKILEEGIEVRGTERDGIYNFLNPSNSGMREERAVYFYKDSITRIHAMISKLGRFVGDAPKRLKRIGLLFSGISETITVLGGNIKEIDDVLDEENDSVYTEGCGLIGVDLVKEFVSSDKVQKIGLPRNFLPCALQLRFLGVKGLFLIDFENPIEIQYRHSQRKFKTKFKPDESIQIGLCSDGISRPFCYGHLNAQYIMNLSTLGVNGSMFERFHDKAMVMLQLQNLSVYHELALEFREYKLAESIRTEGLSNEIVNRCRGLKKRYIQKMTKRPSDGLDMVKLRIRVKKSRFVFGAPDPYGKLKPGEVFFRTLAEDGKVVTIRGDVIVTRPPTYVPGDTRILRAVDPGPKYDGLVDVLLFSTLPDADLEDPVPEFTLMSGGDLDGDRYFVVWDPDLNPRNYANHKAFKAEDYRDDSHGGEKKYFHKCDAEDEARERMKVFADYDPYALGLVDSVLMQYANVGKQNSRPHKKLNMIFQRIVDGKSFELKKVLDYRRRLIHDKPDRSLPWLALAETTERELKKQTKTKGLITETEIDDDGKQSLLIQTLDSPLGDLVPWSKPHSNRTAAVKGDACEIKVKRLDVLKRSVVTQEPKKIHEWKMSKCAEPNCLGTVIETPYEQSPGILLVKRCSIVKDLPWEHDVVHSDLEVPFNWNICDGESISVGREVNLDIHYGVTGNLIAMNIRTLEGELKVSHDEHKSESTKDSWMLSLNKGERIDVLNSRSRWIPGIVKRITKTKITVSYEGVSSSYDEEIPFAGNAQNNRIDVFKQHMDDYYLIPKYRKPIESFAEYLTFKKSSYAHLNRKHYRDEEEYEKRFRDKRRSDKSKKRKPEMEIKESDTSSSSESDSEIVSIAKPQDRGSSSDDNSNLQLTNRSPNYRCKFKRDIFLGRVRFEKILDKSKVKNPPPTAPILSSSSRTLSSPTPKRYSSSSGSSSRKYSNRSVLSGSGREANICFAFRDRGSCRHGDNCQYKHSRKHHRSQ